MPLPTGLRLGAYEILEPLGAGGMGEVYKARDIRLERTVAIKVLPSHLAQDPKRRERFEREARAVSSLNHPHICTLHEFGSEDGIDFIVMEHIEGETLAEALSRRALPLERALRAGIQLADALDKAHRQGVVHRDVKPGNIMLARSGVKLFDFGLAKPRAEAVAAADSESPTEHRPLTDEGALLGTVPYMAPEQLEGGEADTRTDIFALGAVLYEMVSGKRAFQGKSQASLIGAILKEHPTPLFELEPLCSPALSRIVQKCLAKDPEDRWQSARDLATELDWIGREGEEKRSPVPLRSPWLAWTTALVLTAVTTTLAALYFADRPAALVTRMKVESPPGTELVSSAGVPFVLSPDGRRVVFETSTRESGTSQLYLRELDRFEALAIPGTEGASDPFFSPDGASLGFVADGAIKKMALTGGEPETICAISGEPRGVSWGESGTLVFASMGTPGLRRVSANGGKPEPVTTIGSEVNAHLDPHWLPKARNALFTATTSGSNHIAVVSLETGEWRILFEGETPRYLPTGHLVYTEGGAIRAVAFDPDTLEARGTPTMLIENVSRGLALTSYVSVSRSGTLAYVSSERHAKALLSVGRSGKETEVAEVDANTHWVRASPDGGRILTDTAGGDSSVWVYDVERGTRVLTSRMPANANPIWSRDGREVTFSAGRRIYSKAADGTGGDRLLFERDYVTWPLSWSPDGRALAVTENHPAGRDIWVLPSEGEPIPFVVTEANENAAAFSPDGRWLAYQSDESGRREIYVQPFPGPGGRGLASTRGGTEPVWSPDGKELFYREETSLMAVAVTTEPALSFGTPRRLFDGPYQLDTSGHPSYDVSPTGEHFWMLRVPPITEFLVVLNWAEELKQRVPTQ